LSKRSLNVGIIGFGSHVNKNVIKHFTHSKNRKAVKILITQKEKYVEKYPDLSNLFTTNYDDLFLNDDISYIYICTPISTHHQFTKLALLNGKHVLCEKPLTSSYSKTSQLIKLAKKKNLLLREVVMYQFHDQFQSLKQLLVSHQKKARLISVTTAFEIPHLEENNFRYSSKHDGGALLDVGYYPNSLIISLFGMPDDIMVSAYKSPRLSIDLSGRIFGKYNDKDLNILSSWAIGATYKNFISIEFEESRIFVDRAFSKPKDLSTELKIESIGSETISVSIQACDHFELMFRDFESSIFNNNKINSNFHYQEILDRAKLTEKIMNFSSN
jgi:predicted dehydrogenase